MLPSVCVPLTHFSEVGTKHRLRSTPPTRSYRPPKPFYQMHTPMSSPLLSQSGCRSSPQLAILSYPVLQAKFDCLVTAFSCKTPFPMLPLIRFGQPRTTTRPRRHPPVLRHLSSHVPKPALLSSRRRRVANPSKSFSLYLGEALLR